MISRLFQYYQRKRILNINLNIVLAGLLAILIAKYPVLLMSRWIGAEHKLINSLLAGVIDAVADALIYFLLHWVANHCKPASDKPPGLARNFWRDASLVQVERLILTPPFYVVAVGGMYGLQHAGITASWSFVYSFTAAIILTRIIHTIWGLRTGRFKDFAPVPGKNPDESLIIDKGGDAAGGP